MRTYIVNIDRRKDEGAILGPFTNKDKAKAALKKYVEQHYGIEGAKHNIATYGGGFDKGEFFSEDEVIEIIERELE